MRTSYGQYVKAKAKKVALLVIGWTFVLLGLVGLFLPVLQGVLFLLVGLFILSSEYVWAHRLLSKVRNRFPALMSQWDHAQSRAHRWMNKVLRRTGVPVS